mgnify:CR=1 FL=1
MMISPVTTAHVQPAHSPGRASGGFSRNRSLRSSLRFFTEVTMFIADAMVPYGQSGVQASEHRV